MKKAIHEATKNILTGLKTVFAKNIPQSSGIMQYELPITIKFTSKVNLLEKRIRNKRKDAQKKLTTRPSYEQITKEKNLKLQLCTHAVVSSVYGVHNLDGIPFFDTVLRRGDPKVQTRYPRGNPKYISPPNKFGLTLENAFYISYLEFFTFGHLLTETASSIYPLVLSKSTNKNFKYLPIIINDPISSDSKQIERLIQLLDIEPDQIKIISKTSDPIYVKNLIIPKQTHINRYFVSKKHHIVTKKLIKLLVKTVQTTRNNSNILVSGNLKIYISRSQLSPQQRLIKDEHKLEAILRQQDWEIFHPEQHSLQNQINRYENASFICAPEGSAVHLLYAINTKRIEKVFLLSKNKDNNFTKQLESQKIKFAIYDVLEFDSKCTKQLTQKNVRFKDDTSLTVLAASITKQTL